MIARYPFFRPFLLGVCERDPLCNVAYGRQRDETSPSLPFPSLPFPTPHIPNPYSHKQPQDQVRTCPRPDANNTNSDYDNRRASRCKNIHASQSRTDPSASAHSIRESQMQLTCREEQSPTLLDDLCCKRRRRENVHCTGQTRIDRWLSISVFNFSFGLGFTPGVLACGYCMWVWETGLRTWVWARPRVWFLIVPPSEWMSMRQLQVTLNPFCVQE